MNEYNVFIIILITLYLIYYLYYKNKEEFGIVDEHQHKTFKTLIEKECSNKSIDDAIYGYITKIKHRN